MATYIIHSAGNIFPFAGSFEMSECILRNQKFIIGLDTFPIQRFIYLALFG